MTNYIIGALTALTLFFSPMAHAQTGTPPNVLSETDVPTEPCIDKDAMIAEIITALPSATATEVGNTVTFTSPERDEDLQFRFDENGCINYSALLRKAPTT